MKKKVFNLLLKQKVDVAINDMVRSHKDDALWFILTNRELAPLEQISDTEFVMYYNGEGWWDTIRATLICTPDGVICAIDKEYFERLLKKVPTMGLDCKEFYDFIGVPALDKEALRRELQAEVKKQEYVPVAQHHVKTNHPRKMAVEEEDIFADDLAQWLEKNSIYANSNYTRRMSGDISNHTRKNSILRSNKKGKTRKERRRGFNHWAFLDDETKKSEEE